jgi:hypothetical protein
MPLVHPMRKPHAPAGFLLGEPQATHCPSDCNHKTRLDHELVRAVYTARARDVLVVVTVIDVKD